MIWGAKKKKKKSLEKKSWTCWNWRQALGCFSSFRAFSSTMALLSHPPGGRAVRTDRRRRQNDLGSQEDPRRRRRALLADLLEQRSRSSGPATELGHLLSTTMPGPPPAGWESGRCGQTEGGDKMIWGAKETQEEEEEPGRGAAATLR